MTPESPPLVLAQGSTGSEFFIGTFAGEGPGPSAPTRSLPLGLSATEISKPGLTWWERLIRFAFP